MPEGDTIHGLAARLREQLVDHDVLDLWTRSVSLESTLRGRRFCDANAVGKHLLLYTDDDHILRIHLGLRGRWLAQRRRHLGRPDGDRTAFALLTDSWRHELISPMDLERFEARARFTHRVLRTLGPDLAVPSADLNEVLRRARSRPDISMADLLLNQRVAAGLGNVYKCELLFMHRLHPRIAVRAVPDATLAAVYRDAHRLLMANIGRHRRTREKGDALWVYGRRGRCIVCGTEVRRDNLGNPHPRRTFWCPTCQASPS